jgi:hypothetical protein
MAPKKKTEQTEKIEVTKNYTVTARNGQTLTVKDKSYTAMTLDVTAWLRDMGLSYPTGIAIDGIKEVD